MPGEEAGTLSWYRADLAARRTAFAQMIEDPALSNEHRAQWAELLANVEVVLADIDQDPLGYMAWLLAENHTVLRGQADRFTQ